MEGRERPDIENAIFGSPNSAFSDLNVIFICYYFGSIYGFGLCGFNRFVDAGSLFGHRIMLNDSGIAQLFLRFCFSILTI